MRGGIESRVFSPRVFMLKVYIFFFWFLFQISPRSLEDL